MEERIVKKSDAFLLNQCFVLMGFVLSLNGMEKMGVCAGIFAIMYSIYSLSMNVLKEDLSKVLLISFIQLCLFELTGINCMYPSLYLLSLSSLVVSFMWSHSGFKARKYGMKWMSVTGCMFLAASILSPYQNFSHVFSFMMTLSIFFPSIILHTTKQYHFYKNRNRDMVVVK